MKDAPLKRIKELYSILWKHGIYQTSVAKWIKVRKKKRGFAQSTIAKLMADEHLKGKHYDFLIYLEEIIAELKSNQLFFKEETDLSSDTKEKIKKVIIPDDESKSTEKLAKQPRPLWKEMELIGPWQISEDEDTIIGEGIERYLVSSEEYGKRAFTIYAKVAFDYINEPYLFNAGFVLGFREGYYDSDSLVREYYNLLFLNDSIVLEEVGFNQGDGYLDFRHISRPMPFKIQPNQTYDVVINISRSKIDLFIDSIPVYSARLPKDVYGKVGIRPWRSKMILMNYWVEQA